jgi:hypothetical protein
MFTAVRVVVTVLLADVKALDPFSVGRRLSACGAGSQLGTARCETNGQANGRSLRVPVVVLVSTSLIPLRPHEGAWVSQGRFMTRAPVASGPIPHRRHRESSYRDAMTLSDQVMRLLLGQRSGPKVFRIAKPTRRARLLSWLTRSEEGPARQAEPCQRRGRSPEPRIRRSKNPGRGEARDSRRPAAEHGPERQTKADRRRGRHGGSDLAVRVPLGPARPHPRRPIAIGLRWRRSASERRVPCPLSCRCTGAR